MRSRKLASAAPMLLLILLLSALIPAALAADADTSETALPNLSTATEVESSSATEKSAAASSASASATASATASDTEAKTTDASATKSASASTSKGVTITPTATGSATSDASSVPSITSSVDSANLPSNLPTLSGYFSYPPPSVPPTADAPFMQKSTMPEGTVFIVVGAILGFLGACVLAWRGLVVWSIHRSVKRAAMQQNLADSKAMLRPPGGGFYSTGAGSTLSLDALATGGRPATQGGKSHTPSGSLFFSPTAGAGSGVMNSNRHSSYLPSGYYAASNSAAGGGSGMTHIGGAPISLSNLGAHAQGYTRARSMGPSPPGSPSLPPSRGNLGSFPSSASINLNAPPQQGGRTPSAYLEDMFDQHPVQPGGRL